MTKRAWMLAVILPLTSTWVIDRITKLMATDLIGLKFYGPLGFVLHHNPGAILGLFSELPPVLRIVSLSTGGAFLVFTFLIIQILLPVKSLTLRSGMSILLGGILGNVADRIAWGYVVDFIVIRVGRTSTPAFNMADALQWVGYAMVVFALFKEGKNLWPEQNLRKSYWINPKFQIRYCLKLMGFGMAFAIIAATYSYTYMKVTISNLVGRNPHIEDRFLVPFIITFAIVSVAFCIILFFVGLILSHRSAGPLYAFERFLDDLFSGKVRKLKLRTGDEFQHLEELAEKLSEHDIIKQHIANMKPEDIIEDDSIDAEETSPAPNPPPSK